MTKERGAKGAMADPGFVEGQESLPRHESAKGVLGRYLLPRNTALAFLAGLGVLSVLHFTGALTQLISLVPSIPLCPFRFLTHLDCPGCGMTRSFVALAGGNLWKAACLNPFSFFLLFVVLLSLIPSSYLDKEPPGTARTVRYFYMAMLVVILLYWVVFRVIRIVPLPL